MRVLWFRWLPNRILRWGAPEWQKSTVSDGNEVRFVTIDAEDRTVSVASEDRTVSA